MTVIQFPNQQRPGLDSRAEDLLPASQSSDDLMTSDFADTFDGTTIESLTEDQIQRISKAIADPQRFAILTCIAKSDELPCKTLVATFSIKQATISHHLKELAAAQLIQSRKQGQRAILSCRRDVCDAYVRALESRFVSAFAQ
jgi:ArsR family transcriptional regulator, arsenate/arsenite/antimonite-responsive transcriptional repressor